MLGTENARDIPAILNGCANNENAITGLLDEIAVLARSESFRDICSQQEIIDSIMSKASVEYLSTKTQYQAYRALANLCIDNDLNRELVVASKLWPVLSRQVSHDPDLSKVVLALLYNLSLGNEHIQDCLARSQSIQSIFSDPPISDNSGITILFSTLESLITTDYFVQNSDWFLSCLLAFPCRLEGNLPDCHHDDKILVRNRTARLIEAYLAANPEKIKISLEVFNNLIDYVQQIENISNKDLFVRSICYLSSSRNLNVPVTSSDRAIRTLISWLVGSDSPDFTTWSIFFFTRFDQPDSCLYRDLVSEYSIHNSLAQKIISYTEHEFAWTSEGGCEAFRLLCLLCQDATARRAVCESKACMDAVICIMRSEESDVTIKSWGLTLLRIQVSQGPKLIVNLLASDSKLEEGLILDFPLELQATIAERQQEAYFSLACILKLLLQDDEYGKGQVVIWNSILGITHVKSSFIKGMQSILRGPVKYKPMLNQVIMALSIMAAQKCGLEVIKACLDCPDISKIFTDDKSDQDIKHNTTFLVVTLKSNAGPFGSSSENLQLLDEKVHQYLESNSHTYTNVNTTI